MKTAKELSEIAASVSVMPKESKVDEFTLKVLNLTKMKITSLLIRFEELATKGFGGTKIKLDFTTDLFHIIEMESRGYSAESVYYQLLALGYSLSDYSDCYDAKSFTVVWNKDLPIDSHEIPMAI